MKNNQKEYDNFKEILDESKADLSSYLEKRLMLAKLQIYEKVASSFSHIAYALIICFFAVIISILVFLGLGLFIGEQLNNYSLGFVLLSILVIIVLLVVIASKRKVRRFLVNLVLRTIKKIEKDEE